MAYAGKRILNSFTWFQLNPCIFRNVILRIFFFLSKDYLVEVKVLGFSACFVKYAQLMLMTVSYCWTV